MKRWLGCLVVSVFVAAGVVVPRPVLADEQDALVKKGVELRRQGKEREALEMFQRAAAIRKTPRVMAQMAFAEQALGQWVKAEADLKAALESKSDPWIVKNATVITAALNTIDSHLGSLEVWGTPAGAEVLLDGEVVGTFPSPGPFRLPLGEVTVTVRHTGYAEVTRAMQISRGALVRENIDLHAVRPLVAVEPPAGTGAGQAGSGGAMLGTERGDLSERSAGTDTGGQSRPVYKRWWFWTAIGVVAVGAAGAGAFLLTHRGTSMMTCDSGVTACGAWGASPAGGALRIGN
jgi:PEGA domain